MTAAGISQRTILITAVIILSFAALAGGAYYFLAAGAPPGTGGPGTTPVTPVTLSPDEQRWIAQHPVVVVCPDPNYPPFEFYDQTGNYSGISADYLHLLAQKTGLNITDTRQDNWSVCVSMIQANQSDLLGAVYTSDLRTGYLNYTLPLYQPPLVIITTRNVTGMLSLDDFKGMTVAAVNGYTSYDLLKEKYPGIEVRTEPDIRTGLLDVSLGRTDAYLGDLPTASWYIEQGGLSNLRVAGEYVPPDPTQFQLAIGVRANEPELRDILNKAILAITPEERTQIANRWIPQEFQTSPFDTRIIWAIISGVVLLFVIIGIIILWNNTLRHAVAQKTRELSEELSERRRTQELLRESERTYRSILEDIQDVFYRTDPDGNLVMLSPSGIKLFGYTSADEILGKNIRDTLYADPGERESVLAAIRKNGSVQDYDIMAKRKDGSVIAVSTTSHTYPAPDGTLAGIEGIIRDISQRKGFEQELVRKNEELSGAREQLLSAQAELKENFNRLKKNQAALDLARKKLNFFNTITFQNIQNAIFTLSGYLELEKESTDAEKILEYHEKQHRVIQTILRILRFADNYKNLGLTPPRWQDVNQSFLFAVSHLDIKRISCVSEVRGLEVFADPLLEEVFVTLEENVIQHAKEATEIHLSCRVVPDGLVLIFSDNGPGVPGDLKEKIFEKGYAEYHDMGLFFTREILSITGITIHETGEYGKGARFEILIPKDGYRFTGTGGQ
ncbi:multi-sensor signal transduction histidine kinase [Methanoregula boonei 6A8]|uniref:histidine kinase n=1 Tax=Methanoregula boonei (strain DSM 21154 / JCM 14090 / 6A8) TaxID=456442 RepID=A7I6D9_METB6|nr:transporter substrate-binding domain-containing protein [Methanoregula boonei]ABS55300.1 multi-sensor signal transduction histidine kinase [Methanoregula boonei 6A8]